MLPYNRLNGDLTLIPSFLNMNKILYLKELSCNLKVPT